MSGYPIAYASPARRAELRSMPYGDYLQTTEWSQVRWFARVRDGFACVMCASPHKLECHHRTYANRGEERPEDVHTVCDECHEKHHGKPKLRLVTERVVHAAALRVTAVSAAEASANVAEILAKLRSFG